MSGVGDDYDVAVRGGGGYDEDKRKREECERKLVSVHRYVDFKVGCRYYLVFKGSLWGT